MSLLGWTKCQLPPLAEFCQSYDQNTWNEWDSNLGDFSGHNLQGKSVTHSAMPSVQAASTLTNYPKESYPLPNEAGSRGMQKKKLKFAINVKNTFTFFNCTTKMRLPRMSVGVTCLTDQIIYSNYCLVMSAKFVANNTHQHHLSSSLILKHFSNISPLSCKFRSTGFSQSINISNANGSCSLSSHFWG